MSGLWSAVVLGVGVVAAVMPLVGPSTVDETRLRLSVCRNERNKGVFMIDLEYQGRCWVAKASDLYRRVGVLGSTLGLRGEWQRRLSLARVRMLALTVQLVEIAMLYHFLSKAGLLGPLGIDARLWVLLLHGPGRVCHGICGGVVAQVARARRDRRLGRTWTPTMHNRRGRGCVVKSRRHCWARSLSLVWQGV